MGNGKRINGVNFVEVSGLLIPLIRLAEQEQHERAAKGAA